jgi:ERF superfamily
MSEVTQGANHGQQDKSTGTQLLAEIKELLVELVGVTKPAPTRKRESEDLRELYKALGAAQKKFADINKTGLISGRNIPYAKINDLVEASRAALHANGLVVNTFQVNEGNGYSTLVTRLYHTGSGQWMESELPLLNTNDEQKRGSSITYAQRYTYSPLIGLVDTSCDDDGEITKPTSQTANYYKK